MIRAILISSLLFLVACSAYKTLPIENKALWSGSEKWSYVHYTNSTHTLRPTGICPSYITPSIIVSKYKQRKNTIILNGIVGHYNVVYDSLLNPTPIQYRANFPYIIYSCNIENDTMINVKEIVRDKKDFKLVLHNDSSKYLILYNCRDSIGFVHNEKVAIEGMFYDMSIK